MKLTLQHISDGPEEVIIRYRERTERIDSLIRVIERHGSRLPAQSESGQRLLTPSETLYLESVDNAVYVYTDSEVLRTQLTLAAAEETFAEDGFFRCSKSMVVNIMRISHLKSIPGSRAEVTLDNGERVIISRRYLKELRRVLKGEET